MPRVKYPTAVQVDSGKWRCRIMVDGTAHCITRDTQAEAEKEAMALKLKLVQAAKFRETHKTLRDICKEWVAENEPFLSPSTVAGYNVIIRNRAEAIMDIPLKKVTQRMWEQSINADRRRLASKTVLNSYMFLAKVLREKTGVSLPVNIRDVRSKERGWLTYDQIEILVREIRGHDLEIPILLALSSLRRSEIIGLTWDKVDLKRGLIRVDSAVVVDKDHKMVKKRTKTRKSTRNVPIIDPLKIALEAVEDRTGSVSKATGKTLGKRINTLLRHADLPEVGCHGLRHSFASLCYHLGVPEKIAQEMGGWEDSGTMHKIYTHIAQADRDHYSGAFLDFFAADE